MHRVSFICLETLCQPNNLPHKGQKEKRLSHSILCKSQRRKNRNVFPFVSKPALYPPVCQHSQETIKGAKASNDDDHDEHDDDKEGRETHQTNIFLKPRENAPLCLIICFNQMLMPLMPEKGRCERLGERESTESFCLTGNCCRGCWLVGWWQPCKGRRCHDDAEFASKGD